MNLISPTVLDEHQPTPTGRFCVVTHDGRRPDYPCPTYRLALRALGIDEGSER